MEEDYITINKKLWNERTVHHVKSDFYDVESFLKGKSVLNQIELDLLEDLNEKSVLHLQCHFGQDSLCLARMGAQVTGVDFSEVAIEKAKELNHQLNLHARFICSDIYELPDLLSEKFDIVYTSYGVIGWLPDMDRWANVIQHFLKPGGKLVFVEFHPVVWMFDNDFTKVSYSYFKDSAIIESESGTYADKTAPIVTQSISWNHSLSEVMQALLKSGLRINLFKEYNYSPYNCFSHTSEIEPGKFIIKHFGNLTPMVYSVIAEKI